MERRFACTACGKCCFGWLPLTLSDALAHAGRFPLAVVWTPVRKGARAWDATLRLGAEIKLGDGKRLAVRIAPTAYVPPGLPCPALGSDHLCSIQDAKPSRCLTMPFFPYRDEDDQADLLVPRKGWECDVSAAAPAVYAGRKIIDRADFDRERGALLEQAPVLRRYAERSMARVPGLADALARAAAKPGGGHVAMGFASLLKELGEVDRAAVAQAQRTVLAGFAARVADMPGLDEYRRNYADWAWELERFT